jgi:hypothetical protein
MKKFALQSVLILVAVIVGLLGVFVGLFCLEAIIIAFTALPVFISFPFLGVVVLFVAFCIRAHSQKIRRRLKVGIKFVVSIMTMTILCTIVWQAFVTEYLYDNTDDNIMGFFGPFFGDLWIGEGGFPIVAVQHVVHGRSMSDPDEIKAGWSVPKLLCLWSSFVAASLVISIALARLRWIPRQILDSVEALSQTESH